MQLYFNYIGDKYEKSKENQIKKGFVTPDHDYNTTECREAASI